MLTKHLEQLTSAASLSLGESLQSCQDLSFRVYPSPFTPSSGRWPRLGTRKCQRAGWEHSPPAGQPAAPAFCSLWSSPCQLACTLPTRPGLEGKRARLNQTRQGLPGHPRAGGRSACYSLPSGLMRGMGSKGERLRRGWVRKFFLPSQWGAPMGRGGLLALTPRAVTYLFSQEEGCRSLQGCGFSISVSCRVLEIVLATQVTKVEGGVCSGSGRRRGGRQMGAVLPPPSLTLPGTSAT